MVEWAPLHMPFSRRLQTLVTMLMISNAFIWYFVTAAMLFFPKTWPFLIPYFIYMYFDDGMSSNGGTRKSDWLRRMRYIDYYRDYFPIRLKPNGGGWMDKQGPMDPKQNYIFMYHPHGVLGMGCMGVFGCDTSGIKDAFPGIDFCIVTLKMNFRVPFYREWLARQGMIDASRESIENRLRSGPGKSCVLVPGGASEALETHTGACKLVLKNRKGFVKIAVREGANLVPVFAYGENDLFESIDNPEGGKIRSWQKWFQAKLGFSMPLIYGRGIFQYSFGMMPRRHPLDVVVGPPLMVTKNPNPTQEDIDKLHAEYLKCLTHLFNKTKVDYKDYREKVLEFV